MKTWSLTGCSCKQEPKNEGRKSSPVPGSLTERKLQWHTGQQRWQSFLGLQHQATNKGLRSFGPSSSSRWTRKEEALQGWWWCWARPKQQREGDVVVSAKPKMRVMGWWRYRTLTVTGKGWFAPSCNRGKEGVMIGDDVSWNKERRSEDEAWFSAWQWRWWWLPGREEMKGRWWWWCCGLTVQVGKSVSSGSKGNRRVQGVTHVGEEERCVKSRRNLIALLLKKNGQHSPLNNQDFSWIKYWKLT